MQSRSYFNIPVLIVLAVPMVPLIRAQEKHDGTDPKFLTAGTVDKIDAKGKTITLIDAASIDVEQMRQGSDSNTPARGGRGGGGGGRGGGGGARGGGGGGRGGGGGGGGGRGGSSGATGGGAGAPQFSKSTWSQFTVEISSKTSLKEGDQTIKLTDLKPGDKVEVRSMNSGSKIHAMEVVRLPKDAPTPDSPPDPTQH